MCDRARFISHNSPKGFTYGWEEKHCRKEEEKSHKSEVALVAFNKQQMNFTLICHKLLKKVDERKNRTLTYTLYLDFKL